MHKLLKSVGRTGAAERGKRRLVAVAVVALIAAAACSSSSKTSGTSATSTGSAGSSAGSSSGTGTTYTLGLLADLTGPISDTGKSTPIGLKAGVGLYNSEGYNLKYVIADTGSSPAGALTAAQKLVNQDHVFAIITTSGLTFAAAPFLTSKGIPVLGAQVDAPEWVTARNMFSVFGYSTFTSVQTTTGNILKLLKANNFAAIGYSISPSSSNAAKSAAASALNAGVKVGYLNTSYPFGSTNVGPAVLAMKAAGVDSFEGLVEQVTSYAILTGLKQQGVTLKVPILSTGFGSDILKADAATQQAAQGAYFLNSFQPVILNTPATQRFSNALQKYAGSSGDDATLNVYIPYVSVDAFVAGLKAAGPNPSQAQFINAMLGMTKYNAAGLYGSHTLSFAMDARATEGLGADNCTYLMFYQGNAFHQVAGGEPICGANIPGKHV